MSLTTARGPLGPDPAGRFSSPLPPGLVYVEPHPRRVQALLDGEVVIDTEQALIVHRPGRTLTYAFPRDVVGGLPSTPEPEATGYVTVAWDAVDTWVEEGRELVSYPPNPYHRVDCRPTTRRLRVEVAATALVDTDDTTIVFETGHEPRLYVDPALVRTDLLRPTATTSYCNYKGWATWWAACSTVRRWPTTRTVAASATSWRAPRRSMPSSATTPSGSCELSRAIAAPSG